MIIKGERIGDVWFDLLTALYSKGEGVSPRDQGTREIRAVQLTLTNPYANIFVSNARDLNYKFMVAEWLWIWFGREDVASISQYNKKIAAYSDDGKTFAGAYGPRIASQWPGLVGRLERDQDTRQAIIQIFPPSIPESKDVPCTLSFQFFIRNRQLEMIVCMRSSDVWLGLPYDIFNFTMIGNTLAARLGIRMSRFTMHIGSSHLYERDRGGAHDVITGGPLEIKHLTSPPFQKEPPRWLDIVLEKRVMGSFNVTGPIWQPPWTQYGAALCADSKQIALARLEDLHKWPIG